MAATPNVDLPGMAPSATSPLLAHTGFGSLDQSMTPRTMVSFFFVETPKLNFLKTERQGFKFM